MYRCADCHEEGINDGLHSREIKPGDCACCSICKKKFHNECFINHNALEHKGKANKETCKNIPLEGKIIPHTSERFKKKKAF